MAQVPSLPLLDQPPLPPTGIPLVVAGPPTTASEPVMPVPMPMAPILHGPLTTPGTQMAQPLMVSQQLLPMQLQQMQLMNAMAMNALATMQMSMVPIMPMQMQPQMQMVPMLPVPAMALQPHALTGLASCTGAPNEDEEENLAGLSEEEIAQRISTQTDLVRETESAAKRAAGKGTFIGTLSRYDPEQGFGFVICPECAGPWGKTDIYVGQKNVVESGLEIGDVLAFQVEEHNGKPRVEMKPKVLKEATQAKSLLARLKAARALRAGKRSSSATVGAPGVKRSRLEAQPIV